MTDDDERLETPKQLAGRVGITERQVRHLVQIRQLEHVPISGNIVRSRGAANCIGEPGGLPEYGRGRIWPSSSDANPAAIQAKAH
jgi:hypothetical protein